MRQNGRSAQRGIIGHLEVVDLPRDDREQHSSLQYRPPLHSAIGGFCRISMCPFTNHDIFLLIFYGGKAVRQCPDLAFNGCDNICIMRYVVSDM
jgi:hypothetical protein